SSTCRSAGRRRRRRGVAQTPKPSTRSSASSRLRLAIAAAEYRRMLSSYSSSTRRSAASRSALTWVSVSLATADLRVAGGGDLRHAVPDPFLAARVGEQGPQLRPDRLRRPRQTSVGLGLRDRLLLDQLAQHLLEREQVPLLFGRRRGLELHAVDLHRALALVVETAGDLV